MTYRIGQVVPYIKPRGLTGAALDKPRWHAIKVQPGREAHARDMLIRHGIHAQYPVEERHYRQKGKRVSRKYPSITQIVYAQFKAVPNWDVMRQRKIITGVHSIGDRPIDLPYDIVADVMGLPTVAEQLERARQELLRVREGDKATLLDGPLAGFMVDVRRVAAGRVWFETITGLRGSAPVDKVAKEG